MRCCLTSGLAALLLTGSGVLAQGPPPDLLDVPYSPPGLVDHERRVLDVYFTTAPVPAEGAPAVLWVHGGGAVTGDKALDVTTEPWASLLAGGVTVLSMNYPYAAPDYAAWLDGDGLPGDDGDPSNDYQAHPDTQRDVSLAVQFVRSQAAAWNLDPDRLALGGFSAGSYLACSVAMAPDGRWIPPGLGNGLPTRTTVLWNRGGVTNLTLPNCCLTSDQPFFEIYVADPLNTCGDWFQPCWDGLKTALSPALFASLPNAADANRMVRARHSYGGPPGSDVHDTVNGADFQARLEALGNLTSEYLAYPTVAELNSLEGGAVAAWLLLALRSQPYGAGLAGSEPFPPLLALTAEGAVDNVTIGHCPVGAATVTSAGLAAELPGLPFLGGLLHIQPLIPLVSWSALADGTGTATLSLDLSPLDQLGIELFLQTVVADPAAPQGFALSNGLVISPR